MAPPQLILRLTGSSTIMRPATRAVLSITIEAIGTNQATTCADAKSTSQALESKFSSPALYDAAVLSYGIATLHTTSWQPHSRSKYTSSFSASGGVTGNGVGLIGSASSAGVSAPSAPPAPSGVQHVSRSSVGSLFSATKPEPAKAPEVVDKNSRQYRTTLVYEATFVDFSVLERMVGELLATTKAKLNITWELPEKTLLEMQEEARKGAVEIALKKARDYTNVLGREVSAFDVEESGVGARANYQRRPRNPRMRLRGGGRMAEDDDGRDDGDGEVSLRPEEIEVSADVVCKFVAEGSRVGDEVESSRDD